MKNHTCPEKIGILSNIVDLGSYGNGKVNPEKNSIYCYCYHEWLHQSSNAEIPWISMWECGNASDIHCRCGLIWIAFIFLIGKNRDIL